MVDGEGGLRRVHVEAGDSRRHEEIAHGAYPEAAETVPNPYSTPQSLISSSSSVTAASHFSPSPILPLPPNRSAASAAIAMAAVSATLPSSSITSTSFFSGSVASASSLGAKPIVGLPALKKVQVSCKAKSEKRENGGDVGAPAAVGAVASALMAVQPAMALVDERLSTEGMGLSLGLSNPLLLWILLGVATLIWSFFFAYSSSLPEGDDDSGLAL